MSRTQLRSVNADVVAERAAVVATLEAVGPNAPTHVEGWDSTALALHLVSGELSWTVTGAAIARLLVNGGVRLDAMSPTVAGLASRLGKRHDIAWALRRLRRRPPPAFRALTGIARVVLLEHWVHHEDLLLANPDAGRHAGVELRPVLKVLARYQRRPLQSIHAQVEAGGFLAETSGTKVVVGGEPSDVARWLGGRGGLERLVVTGDADSIESVRALRLTM